MSVHPTGSGYNKERTKDHSGEYRPDAYLPPMLQLVNMLGKTDIIEQLDIQEADVPALVFALKKISPHPPMYDELQMDTILSLALQDREDGYVARIMGIKKSTVTRRLDGFWRRAFAAADREDIDPAGIISRHVLAGRPSEELADEDDIATVPYEDVANVQVMVEEPAATQPEQASEPPVQFAPREVGAKALKTTVVRRPASVQPPARYVPLTEETLFSVYDSVLLAPDDETGAWQERALCAQTDPEIFFPEKGGSTREAKRICLGCEVRSECLEYAMDKDERFGIWGGLSERERRRLKKGII